MESKVIPFDQSFSDYSRRVGIVKANLARPHEVVKGGEITRLFDRAEKQNKIIDNALANVIVFPPYIPDIIA